MYLPTSSFKRVNLEGTIYEDEKAFLESADREVNTSGEQSLYLHEYHDGRVKLEPVAE